VHTQALNLQCTGCMFKNNRATAAYGTDIYVNRLDSAVGQFNLVIPSSTTFEDAQGTWPGCAS